MKDAKLHIHEIRQKVIQAGGAVLLLDFDGTLAEIAQTPESAYISARAEAALQKYAGSVPIAIISGRSLSETIKKVGVPGIAYAGNHGLEWRLGSDTNVLKPSEDMSTALAHVKREASELVQRYPGLLIEDKTLTLAVHYRGVDEKSIDTLREEVTRIAEPYLQNRLLKLSEGKCIFDIVPRTGWNKGRCARLLFERLREGTGRQRIPVYIGDDTTDETAFKEFVDFGITIRVGQSEESAAQYFFSERSEVDRFIDDVAQISTGQDVSI